MHYLLLLAQFCLRGHASAYLKTQCSGWREEQAEEEQLLGLLLSEGLGMSV